MGGRFPRAARTWMVAVGVALGVSLVLPASPAAAHNSLTGSDPANGARVAAAPKQIELRFLAKLNPDTTKITVVGPGDVAALGGEPTFSGSRVKIPFAPGAAGPYVVSYQLGSADGHPIKGQVRFTLTPGPSPSPDAAPTGVAPTPAASATAAPSAAPVAAEEDDGGATGWVWALGGLALVAALAAALLLRRRRPPGSGPTR
ncbi:copper resistance CopC family protein [Micromonospora okii]|uniref:copper resistance CopC family protein n=1 Tax=Micromonospora okii TaxID=1182970 RepID=UPI001E628D1D|nr:copper resistance CopC family protein [Micromonospora okii]